MVGCKAEDLGGGTHHVNAISVGVAEVHADRAR